MYGQKKASKGEESPGEEPKKRGSFNDKIVFPSFERSLCPEKWVSPSGTWSSKAGNTELSNSDSKLTTTNKPT